MERFDIIILLTVLASTFSLISAAAGEGNTTREGFGPGRQDWGHIKVRRGAYMFYWLYATTADEDYTKYPLVIWLQGGPGASSTGYGNFEEIGPLTLDLQERNTSWVKDMNVLFIDNPVGTGFSYVESIAFYSRNNLQIALDLVEFTKQFFEIHPELESTPLHIFSESYGGKMAAEFGLELHKAIHRREVNCNLTSVVLGDSWISPIDSVLSWAPLLLNMGLVDHKGYENIMASANKTEKFLNENKSLAATTQWGLTQKVVMRETYNIDFYDILREVEGPSKKRRSELSVKEIMQRTLLHYDLDEDRDQMLTELMQEKVAPKLGVSRKWGAQSEMTFQMLRVDFMKPVLGKVESLLNSTDLMVSVITGQKDLICATPGTINAINKLNFKGKEKFEAAPRRAFSVNRVLEGYEKISGRFSIFWVNRAGHMVPADNPSAMSHILGRILG